MDSRMSNACGYLRARLVAVTVVALVLTSHIARAQPESRLSGVVRDATGSRHPRRDGDGHTPGHQGVANRDNGDDGTYSLPVVTRHVFSSSRSSGIPPRRAAGRRPGRRGEAARFPARRALSEEITVTAMKREQTLLDVPFSVAAPTEEDLRERGVEDIEGVAANVAGFTVQNLGPGQSQVAHARRLRRPDRARPAGRQGAGRRLPRRVGHLAVALHARTSTSST